VGRFGLIVAAVVLVVGATTQGAASAARWHGSEPSGDVTATTFDSDPPPCGTYTHVTDAAETSADITGLAVDHREHQVHLVARFRDLQSAGQMTTFTVKTPRLQVWKVVVYRDGSTGRVRTWFGPKLGQEDLDECGFGRRAADRSKSCRHLEAWISPRRDTVAVDVPRRCVGKPRWVRIGVDSERLAGAGGAELTDVWQPAGALKSWYGPVGRRVRHG
jgi:hypothetical protein